MNVSKEVQILKRLSALRTNYLIVKDGMDRSIKRKGDYGFIYDLQLNRIWILKWWYKLKLK